MRIFQIGAAGGVGRPLAQLLTARGEDVTGMHRKPEQAEAITATSATAVPGDLVQDTVADLAAKMSGHDAVVFSAGAHGAGTEQTTLIDGNGLKKAAEAAEQAGVSRFVLVSVFPEAGRGPDSPEAFEHYMRIKKDADVHVAATGLEWLIVRPGTLVDTAGTGRVTAGPAIPYGTIPRADVAAFIDAALAEPSLRRAVVELTGGNTPVAEAVTALTTTH
ncbi:NAD(P)H-binding protein [Arthrobacter rhombi]|uniref:NAD(P)H-binding protein n=1 Tax=Arthrobacter rhombi TaxID=71253 RepID=UPI003FCF32CD